MAELGEMTGVLALDERTKVWLAKAIRGHATSVLDVLGHTIANQATYKEAEESIERLYEELEWLLEFADRVGVERPDIQYRMKNIERMARRVSAHLARMSESTHPEVPSDLEHEGDQP
jgi:histone H3/H4